MPVRIDVWSDYVCPFCYLELPVLDRLQKELGDQVSVRWRAFELRPEPVPTLDPDAPYLHRVWGQSVYPMAKARGMMLGLPPVQPRSRKAHEAAAFARAVGRFEAMNAALFRAFFAEGRDIGDPDELVAIGRSTGLDAEALRSALAEGCFTEEVLAEEAEARRLGVDGVPAMVLAPEGEGREAGRGLLVKGAHPYERVRDVAVQLL